MKFRNYEDKDESQIVKLLNLAYGHFGSVEYWRRKYKLNAGFDPKMIFLAEDKGNIVSCVQYLRRDLKLGNRSLPSYVGGDGATHPEYAGKGLFSKLLYMLYQEVRSQEGSIVYGYQNQTIYDGFYRKRFGEVALHRPSVMMKVLNQNKLIVSILPVVSRLVPMKFSLGKDKTLTIRLELGDQPPIDCCIINNKIKPCKTLAKPDIRIRTSLKVLLETFSDGYSPLKALLLRRIRINMSVSTLIRLLILAVKMRLKK